MANCGALLAVDPIPLGGKDESYIKEWMLDPWFDITFVDAADTNINLVDNRVAHICYDRPDYKPIDAKADLLLNENLWNIFLFDIANENVYGQAMNLASTFLRTQGIYHVFAFPNYISLPFISNNKRIVTFIPRGVYNT
jgi:hypothetical protein